MTPKIIHFCWFGGNPLPQLALDCITSWKKFFPDYEIWAWVENTNTSLDVNLIDKFQTFDVNCISYTSEAYQLRKYAFVSDYARFWILNKFGGVYFDTDVEVISSMDNAVSQGNFLGFETDPDGENTPERYAPGYSFGVNPGLGCGFEKGHPFTQKMMDFYKGIHYCDEAATPWRKTVVAYTTEMLCHEGLQNIHGIQDLSGIKIYPREYFAPINVITGRLHITPRTLCIHHYMGSWTDSRKSFKSKIRNLVPEYFLLWYNKRKRSRYRLDEIHS